MEANLGVLIVRLAGIALVGLALSQGLVTLLSGVRRLRGQRLADARARELFDERIATQRMRRFNRGLELDAWSGWRKFRVSRKIPEGGGICSFHLEPHDSKPIPSFKPGQFLTFQFPVPGEPRPLVRCYSLSDAPDPARYRVSIKRLSAPRDKPDAPPGKASCFCHDELEEGGIVDVKAPSGNFHLDLSQPSPVVLIGGGVGVTPMLSMLNAIARHDFDREVWFFYGVRDGSELIMREHLEQMVQDADGRLHLHVCMSRVDEADLPSGRIRYHSGIVSVDLMRELLPSSNYDFFICGPPPMMSSVTDGLRAWQVPEPKVHFEAFGPASVPTKGTDSAVKHTVVFEKSGVTVEWGPEYASLLECAERNGVALDSGCRAGNCGSCVSAIKSGEVTYRSDPSVDVDSGSCLTCIGVPASDLVLHQ